jgi:hypothetical protein
MSSVLHPRVTAIASILILVALARLLPHPPNFTPVMALALFGGAVFADRRLALLLPLGAMLLSDLFLGFHLQMISVYAAFVLAVVLGTMLRERRRPLPIVGATLSASVLFFIVTNFSVWLLDGLYPLTFEGLMASYTAAIPFFRNAVLGDLFYAAVLFGGLALAERQLTWMREAPLARAG